VFLGLDTDVALGAVCRQGITGDRLDALKGRCIRTLSAAKPGCTTLLPTGHVCLVRYAAGAVGVHGKLSAIRCYPAA
jgi:hypothetical protein